MVLPSRPDPRRRPSPPPPSGKRSGPGFWRRLFARWFGPRFRPDLQRYRAYQSRQTVLRLNADLGSFDSISELRQRLVDRGLAPMESAWTFYLPAGSALEKALPLVRQVYGPGVGLKILKDFQPPEDAIYATHDLALGSKTARRRLTPSPTALLRVAGLLHAAGLGPRTHDLVHLKAGDRDLSAYVVDHVAWTIEDPASYRAFMSRLRPVLRNGFLAPLGGRIDTDTDFRSPDCNDNLRIDPANGEPLYVDFQAFAIPDEMHLIRTFARDALAQAGGDRRRLYQSIPGAMPGLRDTEARAAAIAALMRKPNLRLDNRVVFDVGCNSGLMMAEALAAGALWAHGWDHGAVAQSASRILAALGCSRFTVHGESLAQDSDLAGMLPAHHRLTPNGVLYYLGIEQEIGYPPGIAYLPWQFMVFEGAPGAQVGAVWRRLQQTGWFGDGGVLAHTLFADDGGEPRPLILARRRLK